MEPIFVYSTVFPGVEAFLSDWYESVLAQSKTGFKLCIGQDAMDAEQLAEAAGYEIDARWFQAEAGATLADVRSYALADICREDGVVIVVDSDDVLMPSRVEFACESIVGVDVSACALELVEQDGTLTGDIMRLSAGTNPDEVLPRHNMFGLSNSVWRTQMLRRCLPVPSGAVLVDWYLVTQAWLFGARLHFDPRVGMLYRQYDRSSARVRPPFTAAQIARDTDKVCLHFELIRDNFREGQQLARQQELIGVSEDVNRFRDVVVSGGNALDDYVAQLNEQSCGSFWWESVAYQGLRHMWL